MSGPSTGDRLATLAGRSLGTSDWVTLDQATIVVLDVRLGREGSAAPAMVATWLGLVRPTS